VSRILAQLRPEWEAWQARDLSKENIERLILDGVVVSVRIGSKSERMTILVALGVRSDGQKVALAFKEMGAEPDLQKRIALRNEVAEYTWNWAVAIGTTPICSPSEPIRRTLGTVISSFKRFVFSATIFYTSKILRPRHAISDFRRSEKS